MTLIKKQENKSLKSFLETYAKNQEVNSPASQPVIKKKTSAIVSGIKAARNERMDDEFENIMIVQSLLAD